MDDACSLRLERCDPAKRMLRFYALQVAPNLFGEWCLLRSWGRIGRQGQRRIEWFATRQAAEEALRLLEKKKRRLNFINEARAQLCEQEVPVFNAVQAPYFTENVAKYFPANLFLP